MKRKRWKTKEPSPVPTVAEADRARANGRPANRIPPLRKACYSLVVATLVFGAAEVAARLTGGAAPGGPPSVGTRKFVTWLSGLSSDESHGPDLYTEDRQLLWRLVPDIQVTTSNHHHAPGGARQSVRITINAQGYRGRSLDAGDDEATFRVLCLGDSNFFGYPLDDQFVFPRALEQALISRQAGSPVQVVNGGVPGYTVAQGRRWYAEKFAGHRFDVILLSYLNNDAWLQPQTDAQLFARHDSASYTVAKLLQHSQLAARMAGWLAPAVPPEEYRERVPLDEFVRDYEFLIGAALQQRSRVIIVDHRAYPEYEPYSRRLQELARRHRVDYYPVAEQVTERLKNLQTVEEYRELAVRAYQRWGELLGQRPYLWYYAEYYPEHLNELGVAWLADQIAARIRGQPASPSGSNEK